MFLNIGVSAKQQIIFRMRSCVEARKMACRVGRGYEKNVRNTKNFHRMISLLKSSCIVVILTQKDQLNGRICLNHVIKQFDARN